MLTGQYFTYCKNVNIYGSKRNNKHTKHELTLVYTQANGLIGHKQQGLLN
jgi:hypothetical protein